MTASVLAALLAVLLIGCEPMASPEADGTPLLGEGGNGPRVGTATPASGGSPLADGDEDDETEPDEEESWACAGAHDCWEKCEEWGDEYDSGTSSCLCKPKEGGGWSCDAKWWKDKRVVGGGGGVDGCGGGGGLDPGDGNPLEYSSCPLPPVIINGSFHVERGTHVTYNVRLDPEWDTMPNLTFRWRAGNNTRAGTVRFWHDRWAGTATETRGISVSVSAYVPGSGIRRSVARKTVTVRPRFDWSFLAGTSGITAPNTVKNGWGTKWGQYERGWERDPFWNIGSGSGPWGGTYYLEALPELDYPDGVYWHPDVTVAGPKYRGADQTCDSVSVSKANLLTVNDACGHRDAFNDLRTLIAKHEFRHQGSLNECLRTVNGGRLMREMEELVVASYEGVQSRAVGFWNVLYPKMLDAKETAQSGQKIPHIWHYRQTGAWSDSRRSRGPPRNRRMHIELELPRYDGHLSIGSNQGGESWREEGEGGIRPSTRSVLSSW